MLLRETSAAPHPATKQTHALHHILCSTHVHRAQVQPHDVSHSFIHSFHSIPFHSIPFHSIPFHSIPFHSIPFHFIPFHFIHFISFHFISFHFISFHFISFHFISFHFISFHFISFHFISFHFISFHFISFHFISFHFISFHFISFHFISFHFISFHFISFHFISFHFISFHFISFHFISFHFISFHFIHSFIHSFRERKVQQRSVCTICALMSRKMSVRSQFQTFGWLTAGRLTARHSIASPACLVVFPSSGFYGVSYQHVTVVRLTVSVLSFSVATERHRYEEALDTFFSVTKVSEEDSGAYVEFTFSSFPQRVTPTSAFGPPEEVSDHFARWKHQAL